MTVKQAKFIKSCADPSDLAGGAFYPQICVAGRSNCGKSSLLNLLMGAKLCVTSQTPGRTRLINVFETALGDCEFEKLYFIDLPGYGYGSASRADAEEWGKRTSAYFESCGEKIAQVLCLADIRRDPSDLDKTLINYVRDLNLPFTVVLTKSDKLSRVKIADAKIKIAAALGVARDNLIVTSALKKTGKSELLARIGDILSVF